MKFREGLDGNPLTFIVIMTRTNRLIELIHDRMLVIRDERTAEDWMNPGERDPLRLKSLLVPAADDDLVLSPASSLGNNVNYSVLSMLLLPTRGGMMRVLYRLTDPHLRVGSEAQKRELGAAIAASPLRR